MIDILRVVPIIMKNSYIKYTIVEREEDRPDENFYLR